jgi:hypothetical protein
MKKTIQLLSILSVLFLFACKQSGSTAASGGSDIVGTWKYSSFDLDLSAIPEDKKASMEMAKSFMGQMFKDAKITFGSDGMCEMTLGGTTDKVKYTSAGNNAYQVTDGNEKIDFVLDGKKLNMKIDKDEMHMLISFEK